MKKIILSLLVLTALLSGCITVNMPGSGNQRPAAYIDQILPVNAQAGETISFTGHGTDPDGTIISYEWRSSLDGILNTTASFKTSSLSQGSHTIYFRVFDNANLWSLDANSTITISAKASKPVIELFTVSAASITRGASIELRWNVLGAGTVSIDNNIGQVPSSGSKVLYPLVDTVYTLTATNDGGSVTGTASVKVVELPVNSNPVISFTAQYVSGTSWQLNWNVQNATQIVIEPEIGQVAASGSKVVNVPSGQSKTYKLIATNSWGWATWQVSMMSP